MEKIAESYIWYGDILVDEFRHLIDNNQEFYWKQIYDTII